MSEFPNYLQNGEDDHHEEEESYSIILGLCNLSGENLDYQQEIERQMEEQKRKTRLGFNDNFTASYNISDFPQLLLVLREYCSENVLFSAPIAESIGVIPILTFFMILNEIFPDSVLKAMEKRIASIKTPNPPYHGALHIPIPQVTTETIEIIDKFTGTRILDKPVVEIFANFVQEGRLHSQLTVPEISQMLYDTLYGQQRAANSPRNAAAPDKVFTFITETSLVFDLQTNKILRWGYTVLAVNSN